MDIIVVICVLIFSVSLGIGVAAFGLRGKAGALSRCKHEDIEFIQWTSKIFPGYCGDGLHGHYCANAFGRCRKCGAHLDYRENGNPDGKRRRDYGPY